MQIVVEYENVILLVEKKTFQEMLLTIAGNPSDSKYSMQQ